MQTLLSIFPALNSYEYRLYFGAQLVSLIGTWLQMVAEGWLVWELTKSAFWVGTITAIGFLPVLLFSLFGGVIVDRFHKRDLLIFTSSLAMVLAFTLGILTISNLITVWMIAILAFILGIVNALDLPTRQSFTIEMVGKEALPSAISLNMGMFNSSRVIGPAIAGLLIARIGVGGAFFVNGLSFIAPLIALSLIKIKSDLPKVHPHPIAAIKEGLSYTFSHPLIKSLIIFSAFFSIFGFSYTTIMPFLAESVFNQGPQGLGIMYAFSGLGALIGTFLVHPLSKKFDELNLIFFGTLIFVIALIVFAITSNFTVALIALMFQGVAVSFPFALTMSGIQHHVDNHVRGRVSSIFMIAFLGMQPIGSFQVGFLTEHFGHTFALIFGAIIVLIASIYLKTHLKYKS